MTQAKDRSATTGSGFGGALRRVLRTAALLLVLLFVASIGLVVGDGREPEPSAAETALREGAAAAETLASTAESLEESARGPDAAQYAETADLLRLHSFGLQPPGPTAERSSPIFSAAESAPPASPPATSAVPTPEAFLTDLIGSYTAAFEAAAEVDRGPARVLASAATAQWLQGRTLARRLGIPAPPIPVTAPDMPDDDAAPPCVPDATLEPEPGLDGARAAVLAEQRASYAYEVAAARAAEPEQLLRGMARHEEAASLGAAILAQHCVAEPLPAPAYALEERFLADPDSVLRELEEQLVSTYADLVGVSAPGPVRDWAIRQLAESAQHVADATGSDPDSGDAAPGAFPGIDPREYPRLPDPAG